MTYEFVYWSAADDALDRLESDPAMAAVLRAVNRTLRRLAADPFDGRLGTTCFVTEEHRRSLRYARRAGRLVHHLAAWRGREAGRGHSGQLPPALTQRHATSVPERAENRGHQRSPTGIVNGLRSGQGQVDPLRETYF
jgi:hypothetical protein